MELLINAVSSYMFFKPADFKCKCGCGLLKYEADVVEKLDKIRSQFGHPIFVNCGCRCNTHNVAVDGAPHSRHVPEHTASGLADAVDISCDPAHIDELYGLVEEVFNGIGDGRHAGNFIHVDLRPLKADGSKTYWRY